jgi:hypothetical protein
LKPVIILSIVTLLTLTAMLASTPISPMALLALVLSVQALSIVVFPMMVLSATACRNRPRFAHPAGICTIAKIAKLKLVLTALGA